MRPRRRMSPLCSRQECSMYLKIPIWGHWKSRGFMRTRRNKQEGEISWKMPFISTIKPFMIRITRPWISTGRLAFGGSPLAGRRWLSSTTNEPSNKRTYNPFNVGHYRKERTIDDLIQQFHVRVHRWQIGELHKGQPSNYIGLHRASPLRPSLPDDGQISKQIAI